jgi:hypothetical protein
MLVSFHKGFIMEGENTVTKKKHFWSKPESERHKIYCTTGIAGICDDSELDLEVELLTRERLNSSGWGRDFSGWQKVLTYEECLEVAARENWGQDYVDSYVPRCKLIVDSLDDWTVAKAAKELTGKQFAQYCRDYGIPCYN